MVAIQLPPLGRSEVWARVNISGRGSAPIGRRCCLRAAVEVSPSCPGRVVRGERGGSERMDGG